MKTMFLTVVWGEQYIEDFLNLSLPTQISKNNLKNSFFKESSYVILTDNQYFELIKSHPIIKDLSNSLNVVFKDISHIPYRNKYERTSHAQSFGLTFSEDFDCVFFLYPDFVCGDGVILQNAIKMQDGWDAIMCPVPPIVDEIFNSPDFQPNKIQQKGYSQINVPPETLVKLSLNYFHPMMQGYNLDFKENSASPPAYIIREVEKFGILIRAFHLHPIVIRVQPENPDFLFKFRISLDEEYVSRLFKTKQNIYFPKDVREFAYCSIRTRDSEPQPVPTEFDIREVHRWAEIATGSIHRELVAECFYWGEEIQNEEGVKRLNNVKENTLELVRRIQYRLNLSNIFLSQEDKPAALMRKRRRKKFKHFKKPSVSTFSPLND